MQSTQPERKSDKEKLFARIRNEKVTLFIGSGFSLAAGAPSARQIISALKNVHPDIEKNELKDVAEVTDKKRRNTAESRTEGSGRGRACGIPQGTGHEESEEEKTQRNTAGSRTEQNAGIPQGAGQKDGASGVSMA